MSLYLVKSDMVMAYVVAISIADAIRKAKESWKSGVP